MTTPLRTIAALYVQERGCYMNLEGVDPWPESRDARTYAGPHPVVAHPPCERWGRFWFGGPQWLKDGHPRKQLGDDGGCFTAALASVRTWGGIIEHPADSHAWRAHGLLAPPRNGGWVPAGDFRGWTCCVSQGNYGHKGDKLTWLYACNVPLPELIWGKSGKRVLLAGLSKARRDRDRRTGIVQRCPESSARPPRQHSVTYCFQSRARPRRFRQHVPRDVFGVEGEMRVLTDLQYAVLSGRYRGGAFRVGEPELDAAAQLVAMNYAKCFPKAGGRVNFRATATGKLAVRCHEALMLSGSGSGLGG